MNPAELPLRDIHLPEAIGWWPLATGWWWAISLVLVSVALVTGALLYRRYRRTRLSYWLKPEFQLLREKYAGDQDALALLQGLSSLLRRACLSLYPRHAVASLTDDAWLDLLDKTGGTSQFTHGPGRLLAQGPYLPRASSAEVEMLLSLVVSWIDHCGRRKLGDEKAGQQA